MVAIRRNSMDMVHVVQVAGVEDITEELRIKVAMVSIRIAPVLAAPATSEA